jgi:hypothetical protein
MAPLNLEFHGKTIQAQPPGGTPGQQDGFVSLNCSFHTPEIEAVGWQAPVTLCPARKKDRKEI